MIDGKDIGNGVKHPQCDIDTVRLNGKCSGGKNATSKGKGGGPGGKRQELEGVRSKSPRSEAKAQYSIYRYAQEQVQWLFPKWEDILAV